MKKILFSIAATATLILSTAIYTNAGCDGTHIYMCKSQFDRAKVQAEVNANCEPGAIIYVHLYTDC